MSKPTQRHRPSATNGRGKAFKRNSTSLEERKALTLGTRQSPSQSCPQREPPALRRAQRSTLEPIRGHSPSPRHSQPGTCTLFPRGWLRTLQSAARLWPCRQFRWGGRHRVQTVAAQSTSLRGGQSKRTVNDEALSQAGDMMTRALGDVKCHEILNAFARSAVTNGPSTRQITAALAWVQHLRKAKRSRTK